MAATIMIEGYPNTKTTIKLPRVNKGCFCNRNITTNELKEIVKQLREKGNVRDVQKTVLDLKNEGHTIHSAYGGAENQKRFKVYKNEDEILVAQWGGSGYYTIDKKEFVQKERPKALTKIVSTYDDIKDNIFTSKRSEKIQEAQVNRYDLFAQYLDEAFKRYNINTCLRKIHFLAQCYHESAGFIDTREKESNSTNPSGGKDFIGRGIKQITHDFNYLACYSEEQRIINEEANKNTCESNENAGEAEKKSLFDIYMDNRDKKKINGKSKADGVMTYLDKNGTKHGFPKDFKETLKEFAKKLATDLKPACVSAGFFWEYQQGQGFSVYEAADNDDVAALTEAINGGENGLEKRIEYTAQLKEIMRYDNCKKNK